MCVCVCVFVDEGNIKLFQIYTNFFFNFFLYRKNSALNSQKSSFHPPPTPTPPTPPAPVLGQPRERYGPSDTPKGRACHWDTSTAPHTAPHLPGVPQIPCNPSDTLGVSWVPLQGAERSRGNLGSVAGRGHLG